MRPSGRVGPVRMRGRRASMFLPPSSSSLSSTRFVLFFYSPHFIILFYHPAPCPGLQILLCTCFAVFFLLNIHTCQFHYDFKLLNCSRNSFRASVSGFSYLTNISLEQSIMFCPSWEKNTKRERESAGPD